MQLITAANMQKTAMNGVTWEAGAIRTTGARAAMASNVGMTACHTAQMQLAATPMKSGTPHIKALRTFFTSNMVNRFFD
ncbi:hypothetical protein [Acidovorax sp. SUPP3334]|uniref:hypothetical protein n=1 Tax=Acidovorax sp. SUPP3334 TaxID=2920881 RepID=UPI0023DE1CE4|nr:hypothetical protein [Acidovorax sp. SUPP3334]GKT25539.1 hypothetical protein AVHM3334_18245 [Acidovorax sp. SUPP3334]